METVIKNKNIEKSNEKNFSKVELVKNSIPDSIAAEHDYILKELKDFYPEHYQKYVSCIEELKSTTVAYGVPLEYDVVLNRSVGLGAAIKASPNSSESFAFINPTRLNKPKIMVLRTMIHEALGHGSFNSYVQKSGEQTKVIEKGLEVAKYSEIVLTELERKKMMAFSKVFNQATYDNQKEVVELTNILKIDVNTELTFTQSELLNKIGKFLNCNGKQELRKILVSYFGGKEELTIGTDLEEAVTDYLSLIMVNGGYDKGKWDALLILSGHKDNVGKLRSLVEYLSENNLLDEVDQGEMKIKDLENVFYKVV